MRILMIHNRYGATARGGAERVVERLAAALHGRGHEVVVARPKDRSNARHILHAAAPRICHLRVTNIVLFERLGRLPVLLRAFWHLIDLLNVVAAVHLRSMLRRIQPDIVHTHNLIGCGGLTPWVIHRSGIPWVHTLHDVQLITPSGLLMEERRGGDDKVFGHHFLEHSIFGRWFRTLRRSIFGNPTIVTSPSRWLLEFHRAYDFFPRSRDVVIGNPIDVVLTPTHPHSPDARAGAGRREGEKEKKYFSPSTVGGGGVRGGGAIRRFLFVGQLEGPKGILVLIEAFRQLRSLYDDVSVHVVGDGALLPMLKRMSRDIRGLVLRGRLDANGVRTALAESDVLVVPSLCAENQPSTILEAYAAGVPVIASRVGGIPEIVRDGETGFLVDPGSVEDLLRALRTCVEDPKRIRAMTTACRATAQEHAADRIANQFEEVYTSVSEGHHAPNGYVHPASREPMGSLREG